MRIAPPGLGRTKRRRAFVRVSVSVSNRRVSSETSSILRPPPHRCFFLRRPLHPTPPNDPSPKPEQPRKPSPEARGALDISVAFVAVALFATEAGGTGRPQTHNTLSEDPLASGIRRVSVARRSSPPRPSDSASRLVIDACRLPNARHPRLHSACGLVATRATSCGSPPIVVFFSVDYPSPTAERHVTDT